MKLLTFGRFGDEAGGAQEQELAPPSKNRMNTRASDRFDYLVSSWDSASGYIYKWGPLVPVGGTYRD
jgi:hypothetical protein